MLRHDLQERLVMHLFLRKTLCVSETRRLIYGESVLVIRARYLRGYVSTGRFEKYIPTNCVVSVQVIWWCYDRENGRVTLSVVGSCVDQRNNECVNKRLVMKPLEN